MRAAKDFRLAQKLTDAASEPLAQRMQAAAFACSLSLGVATQDNVKILEAPLKVDAAQGMTIAGGCSVKWASKPLLLRSWLFHLRFSCLGVVTACLRAVHGKHLRISQFLAYWCAYDASFDVAGLLAACPDRPQAEAACFFVCTACRSSSSLTADCCLCGKTLAEATSPGACIA